MVQDLSSRERYLWVDYARGMAILLVVYRHAVVGLTRSGIDVTPIMYNLQEIVFNFRMPVFFILSGIFLSKVLTKKSVSIVAADKVATLLYPYLLWSTITILLQIGFSKYSNAKPDFSDISLIFLQPRAVAHFWYLLALFNTSILYLLLQKVIRNVWIHMALALALHYLSTLVILNKYSLITDLFYFYPFLFIGTKLFTYLMEDGSQYKLLGVRNLFWVLPAFLLGQYFWFLNRESENQYLFLFFFIILVGCYFFYNLAEVLSRSKAMDGLRYLGRYSLYIYILHVFFISLSRNVLIKVGLGEYVWFILLVSWILGVTMPVVLFNALKQTGFIKLFTLKQMLV